MIAKLIEPFPMDSNQQRIFTYLTSFIGNLTENEVSAFLRFVTGSSSLLAKGIQVSFNNLTGMARRPISHTCSCELLRKPRRATFRALRFAFRFALCRAFVSRFISRFAFCFALHASSSFRVFFMGAAVGVEYS